MTTTETQGPILFRATPESVPRMGGPERCPRPCAECESNPGTHHFAESTITLAEDEPDHEAAKAGIEAWFQCKHCACWLEWMADSDELGLYRWDPMTGKLEVATAADAWEEIGEVGSLEDAHELAQQDAADEVALDGELDDEDDNEPGDDNCFECGARAGEPHVTGYACAEREQRDEEELDPREDP